MTRAETAADEHIGRLTAALGDSTRRRVFFAVRSAGRHQSKDDVAAAVGIDRRLAGFHLDKLVEHGFLDAELGRREGGAVRPGRRPKLYRVAEAGVLTAMPERHYDLLASLLLRAARSPGGATQETLERVGYDFGVEVGLAELAAGRSAPGPSVAEAVQAVAGLLSRYGFAAHAEGEAALRACACPFQELAFDDPERICGLDRAIWSGMLAAFRSDATLSVDASRARGDGACVATVSPA